MKENLSDKFRVFQPPLEHELRFYNIDCSYIILKTNFAGEVNYFAYPLFFLEEAIERSKYFEVIEIVRPEENVEQT